MLQTTLQRSKVHQSDLRTSSHECDNCHFAVHPRNCPCAETEYTLNIDHQSIASIWGSVKVRVPAHYVPNEEEFLPNLTNAIDKHFLNIYRNEDRELQGGFQDVFNVTADRTSLDVSVAFPACTADAYYAKTVQAQREYADKKNFIRKQVSVAIRNFFLEYRKEKMEGVMA